VVSLSEGRTAAAQCGLFTYKSVPVIFEPPCIISTHSQVINSGGECDGMFMKIVTKYKLAFLEKVTFFLLPLIFMKLATQQNGIESTVR